MSLTRQERHILAALDRQFGTVRSSRQEMHLMPWSMIRTYTSLTQELLLLSISAAFFVGGVIATSPVVSVLALVVGSADILALSLRFLVWLNTNAAVVDDRQPENH